MHACALGLLPGAEISDASSSEVHHGRPGIDECVKAIGLSHLSNGLVGAWADAERPAQNQPLSVEIKPSLFDCKRPPIINLYRRSNAEPLPFKPEPSPSKCRRPPSPSVSRGRPSFARLRQSISGVSRTVELRYQSAAFGHPLIDGHYRTIDVRHSLEELRRKTVALHRLCGNVGYSSVDVQCLRFARDKKSAVKQGCALLHGS